MLSLFLSFLLMISSSVETSKASLSVTLTNVNKTGGTMRVALYKPGAKFGETPPDFFKNVIVSKAGNQTVAFDVPPGRYAIAVYHDVNDNDKLDKNMVGYPKEPFGFSNNYRPRVSAPSFEDCAFDLKSTGTAISIKLID